MFQLVLVTFLIINLFVYDYLNTGLGCTNLA